MKKTYVSVTFHSPVQVSIATNEDEEAPWISLTEDPIARDLLRIILSTEFGEPMGQGLAIYFGRHDMGGFEALELHSIYLYESDGFLHSNAKFLCDRNQEQACTEKIRDYISGQLSDGWGEGMECRDYRLGNKIYNYRVWYRGMKLEKVEG